MLSEKFSAVVLQWKKTKPKAEAFLK